MTLVYNIEQRVLAKETVRWLGRRLERYNLPSLGTDEVKCPKRRENLGIVRLKRYCCQRPDTLAQTWFLHFTALEAHSACFIIASSMSNVSIIPEYLVYIGDRYIFFKLICLKLFNLGLGRLHALSSSSIRISRRQHLGVDYDQACDVWYMGVSFKSRTSLPYPTP